MESVHIVLQTREDKSLTLQTALKGLYMFDNLAFLLTMIILNEHTTYISLCIDITARVQQQSDTFIVTSISCQVQCCETILKDMHSSQEQLV